MVFRNTDVDGGNLFAQYITSSGDTVWTGTGVAVSTAIGAQQAHVIVGDGKGGVLVAWDDERSGEHDIYAQTIDSSGRIGSAHPTITSIADVAGDQGGKIRVTWSPSNRDLLAGHTLLNYQVYRGTRSADTIVYATLGTVPATQQTGYSFNLPTLTDSSAGGTPWYQVKIRARESASVYWESVVDSGYSVDNLAPAPPANPVITGFNTLHWNRNTGDPDVAAYRIHRSTTNGFEPDVSTLIGSTVDTLFVDTDTITRRYYYRVTTVDIHDNEGLPSVQVTPVLTMARVRFGLGGPYNAVTQRMDKMLNTSGYLATRYSVPVHPDAVDSVTIEIRDSLRASHAEIRAYAPAWLLTDGTIRDFRDTSVAGVEFAVPAGNYHVVVYHDSHLPVISASPQSLTATSAVYDFSTAQSQAYGTNPMLQIGFRFLLYPGDGNHSGIITTSDANRVFGNLNATGYNSNDINLSGIVSAADANMVLQNLNQAGQVP